MRGAIVCLTITLAGCTLHAKREASLPPAPKPDLVKPSADPPLSIPQTSASLNTPREWNAAGIPSEPPPAPAAPPKVEAPPATTNAHRTPGPPIKTQEATGTPDATDPAATPEEQPASAAPAAGETAPFQPILSTEQQNQLKTAITTRRHDINSLLTKAAEHGGNDQTLVDRIRSFLNLADEAEKHSDYTQADALSQRALVLAQELKVE
jgi:hypothetical protein